MPKQTPKQQYETLARLSADIQRALVEHHLLAEDDSEIDAAAPQMFPVFGTVSQITKLRQIALQLKVSLEFELTAAQSDYKRGYVRERIAALDLLLTPFFPATVPSISGEPPLPVPPTTYKLGPAFA